MRPTCIRSSRYPDMDLAQLRRNAEPPRRREPPPALRPAARARAQRHGLVRVTGISQSRVSTHLAGCARRASSATGATGTHAFYALALDTAARDGEGASSTRRRSRRPDARGRSAAARGARRRAARRAARVVRRRDGAALLAGPHVAVARGRASPRCSGSATCSTSARATARPPATLAPYCRSLTCIDTNARMIEAAQERLGEHAHVRARGRRRSRAAVRARVVRHGARLPHPDVRRAPGARARGVRARAPPGGRLVVLCRSTSTSSARSPPATASVTPASLRARCARLLSRAGLDVVVLRRRVSRGQEAPFQVVLAIADKPTVRLSRRPPRHD